MRTFGGCFIVTAFMTLFLFPIHLRATESRATPSDVIDTVSELPRFFRPGFSLSIRSVETDPSLAQHYQMGWLGVQVDSETALIELAEFEVGVGGHFFNSVAGLSPDAFRASLTETSLGAFFRKKFKPGILGAVHLKGSMGFYGNWRSSEDIPAALPPFRGVRACADVSTSYDERLRFGTSLSYVFAEEGILQAGGYIKHRLFTINDYGWDARLGMDISVARFKSSLGRLQETWSAFGIGVSGSI